ncbi:hypothetical protein GCM10009744_06920 [Kribbella alba]|uniref:Aminoglycoside phosphotransferase domain-containing protein n=1 Tax=Kribbella alba TaxID=190197 RepID=A0ABP4QZ60_9ACTN
MKFFEQYAEGPVELIGQGMEGAVYDLGGDLVGKVWFNRSAAEIQPLHSFLEELAAQKLSFRTPAIQAIDEVDGRAVSVEAKLSGTPLQAAVETGLISQDRGFDIFAEIVSALGATVAGPASKALPLLQRPFWTDRASWGEALAALVLRRATESRSHLQADVDNFDKVLPQVVSRLGDVQVDTPRIVHGDICTPNLLVNEEGQTAALLDWGFLTTAGDNTFDAGTAAGFYDMYGPQARAIDDLLLDRFESEGHSRERMLLYRAAYAIVTATIYSPDASDGHYRWCVASLNRPDVRASL